MNKPLSLFSIQSKSCLHSSNIFQITCLLRIYCVLLLHLRNVSFLNFKFYSGGERKFLWRHFKVNLVEKIIFQGGGANNVSFPFLTCPLTFLLFSLYFASLKQPSAGFRFTSQTHSTLQFGHVALKKKMFYVLFYSSLRWRRKRRFKNAIHLA